MTEITSVSGRSADAAKAIAQLRKQRPKNTFLRWSVVLAGVTVLVSWFVVEVDWSQTFSERRIRNIERFATEINPLRDQPFEWSAFFSWLAKLWTERGSQAVLTTFWISFAAIALAAAAVFPGIFLASRNLARADPFAPTPNPVTGKQKVFWGLVTGATRALFIFTRAIPEYIWAFLFVAMFGPSAWPAILALMIHNFGVLGRLGADVTENIEPAIPSALRVQGLSRTQIALVAITPMSLGKWLLFFFYRWETCIREATVLGMLGIVSLGFMIRESRARDHYDEMLAFVLMGSVLVLLADILSAIARRYVRTS
jgi:phosphonate transport system permease protein